MNNADKIKISNHVMERYAERILNKKDKIEINRYVASNSDKMEKDIMKMIAYGNVIYSGKNPRKDKLNQSSNLAIYNKDSWFVLVNTDNNTVITMFKKDLGLGDEEFNKQYVEKLIEKFKSVQNKLNEAQEEVEEQNSSLNESVRVNDERIANYRAYIKQLEEANSGYKAIMSSNYIKVKEVEEELNDVLELIITK